MNDKQDMPPMLHRDDLPMDVAEKLVAKLKQIGEKELGHPIKVVFAGDMTTKQKEAMPEEFNEEYKKFLGHTAKCFIEGLCHSCGAKFPYEWPPTHDEDWSFHDWSFYDTNNEQGMAMLVCPECEEEESDGEPRSVE